MLETVVVILIVGAAAFFTGRSLWKATKGKKSGCGCGDACPASKKDNRLVQIKIK